MAQAGTILDYKGAFATKQSKLPNIQTNPGYDVTFNPIAWDHGNPRGADGRLLPPSQVYGQFGNPFQRNAGAPVIGERFDDPVYYDPKDNFNMDPAVAPPSTVIKAPPRKLTKAEKKLKKQGYTYTFDNNGNPVFTAPVSGLAGQLAAGMAVPPIANPMMQAAGLAGMLGTAPMTGSPAVGMQGQHDVMTPMSYPVPIFGYGR